VINWVNRDPSYRVSKLAAANSGVTSIKRDASLSEAATLMKQDGSSRRKLSKRRDPEANVSFYIEQGYPAPAVQYYLRGLANGRLAESGAHYVRPDTIEFYVDNTEPAP